MLSEDIRREYGRKPIPNINALIFEAIKEVEMVSKCLQEVYEKKLRITVLYLTSMSSGSVVELENVNAELNIQIGDLRQKLEFLFEKRSEERRDTVITIFVTEKVTYYHRLEIRTVCL